jgi:hypothetical protein
MDYDKPHKENGIVNEPSPVRGLLSGKKVRVFNSFEEQEDEMIEYWASITPLQRLTHLYEMIKISFRLTEEDMRGKHISGKVRISKLEL